MSEAELEAAVVELARQCGWRAAHFRPARTARGWRTPVAYDGAGFPDLVLVRPGRCMFVECKSDRGRVRPEQSVWLELLEQTGAEVHIWRPSAWRDGTVEEALR